GAWASKSLANPAPAHAVDIDGVSTTGLGNVDLWVGGLAEQIMPFGSMLGSTFQFVFETQLENLQSGDRFYYLSRTAGLQFGTQLEQTTFSQMVIANTDVTHLPADIFSAPTWFLEVDPTKQHTGLGLDGRADPTTVEDPTGGIIINAPGFPTAQGFADVVIRDNPDTVGPDTNYLRYTRENHVLLGGTARHHILIS